MSGVLVANLLVSRVFNVPADVTHGSPSGSWREAEIFFRAPETTSGDDCSLWFDSWFGLELRRPERNRFARFFVALLRRKRSDRGGGECERCDSSGEGNSEFHDVGNGFRRVFVREICLVPVLGDELVDDVSDFIGIFLFRKLSDIVLIFVTTNDYFCSEALLSRFNLPDRVNRTWFFGIN